MEIRKLRADEIPGAAEILAQGRELLRSRGIPQWQRDDYPGVRELTEDVARCEAYAVGERKNSCELRFFDSGRPVVSSS